MLAAEHAGGDTAQKRQSCAGNWRNWRQSRTHLLAAGLLLSSAFCADEDESKNR